MYRNIVKAKNRVLNKKKKRYLYQQDDMGLPANKVVERIRLKDSNILKNFRQKNAIHPGDRESALSVSCNFNYDLVGHQSYEFKMKVKEPDFDIDKSMLVKLGQIPLPEDNFIDPRDFKQKRGRLSL